MYNLNDNSGGYSHGGSYSGAGIMPTVALQGANTGGYAMPMPMMVGNACDNSGLGGDGIWAILLLALLGRGGLSGGFGGDCSNAVPTIISDNVNGRFGALSDQIASTSAAGISATQHASVIESIKDVDSQVCAGFLQTQKGFADVALESCRDTGIIVNAINSNSNAINANITQVGTQGLLAEMRTQAQLSDCCCRLENAIHSDGEATRSLITQNTIQDLRDKLADRNLEASQCAQNAYLASLINPPVTRSVPVFGNAPMFTPSISAESFCGFGDTSFRNRGNSCGC